MRSISEQLKNLGLVEKERVTPAQGPQIRLTCPPKEVRLKKDKPRTPRKNGFCSVREFLNDARERLVRSPSESRAIIRDAHILCDELKLNRKERSRLHKFLCRTTEEVAGMDCDEADVHLAKAIRKY